MDRGTSLYLDAVRFAAACTVFLSHFATQGLSGGLLWQAQPFGAQDVDVFFVLSGYVIGYAADRRERSATAYAASRAARLLSVTLPALVLTFGLDAVGQAIDPQPYHAVENFRAGAPVVQALAGLFFVNEVWGLHVPFGSNVPYWSMGYEVWFYGMFGLAFYAPRGWRLAGAGAAALLAGPPIVSLFPLWLLGFAVWRLHEGGWPRRPRLRFLCAAGGPALWLLYVSRGRPDLLPLPPWIDRPLFWQDNIVGLCFALHLLGLGAFAPALARMPAAAQAVLRRCAGATFALYLFHFPVMVFVRAACGMAPAAWGSRVLVFLAPLVVVAALVPFTEQRKTAWRHAALGLAGRLGLPPA